MVRRNSRNYTSLPYNAALKDRARELRNAGNLAEVLFWNQVKRGKFQNLDFDRQKIIGNYIVDFYCPNRNTVVEIDGGSHAGKQNYDIRRDEYLKSLGLHVIHLFDSAILGNANTVMEELAKHPAFCSCPENHPDLRAPLQRRGIKYNHPGASRHPSTEGNLRQPP
ncbi:MAG: endonuclease domain-containing protein, partial [Kiritimatiellaeota bacterium]|nr:endonuclease domain-containing protein [Kiritimatiellota bacterium]